MKLSELNTLSPITGDDEVYIIRPDGSDFGKASVESILGASRLGSYFMLDNATATVITTQNVFVKIAGTTEAGVVMQGFAATNNRLTLTGASGTFAFSTTLTIDDGAGTRFAVKYYIIPANGDPPFLCPQCKGTAQIPPGGAEITFPIQSIIPLNTGDAVEVWVANETGTADAVVKNLNTQAVSV